MKKTEKQVIKETAKELKKSKKLGKKAAKQLIQFAKTLRKLDGNGLIIMTTALQKKKKFSLEAKQSVQKALTGLNKLKAKAA